MAWSDWRFSRRQLIAEGGFLATLAAISGRLLSAERRAASPRAKKNIYERLGVRTRINAKGTYTYLTGSLLPPEVAEAMRQALQMDQEEKASRMTKMRATVREHNIYRWAGNLVEALSRVRLDQRAAGNE